MKLGVPLVVASIGEVHGGADLQAKFLSKSSRRVHPFTTISRILRHIGEFIWGTFFPLSGDQDLLLL